ncbi:MAG: type II toxin-antitoxin system PemK/MazF family toxin [Candidatus Aminicenantes bacterium]|nr:type II toxin-antitoxin system PemK/MazF family toxin [Candidatus Aminicenantes bacterium]
MRTRELKVARIGNSRGVRLPAASLKRYSVGSVMIMEERAEGMLLRPAGPAVEKLTWEDTAREMAATNEDWSEWDVLDGDGLDSVPWEASNVFKPHSRKEAVKRYEVRWADLDPSRGAEMAKTRPVVIVSLDELNARLQTVTVCPITSRLHPVWRCRLSVRCEGRPAEIAVDQIRAVSKARLGSRVDALSDDEASALRRLITEMFGE